MSPFIDHDASMAAMYRRDPEGARESIADALENWSAEELSGILKQMLIAFPAEPSETPTASNDAEGFELPSPNSLSALLNRVGLELTLTPIKRETAESDTFAPTPAQAA